MAPLPRGSKPLNPRRSRGLATLPAVFGLPAQLGYERPPRHRGPPGLYGSHPSSPRVASPARVRTAPPPQGTAGPLREPSLYIYTNDQEWLTMRRTTKITKGTTKTKNTNGRNNDWCMHACMRACPGRARYSPRGRTGRPQQKSNYEFFNRSNFNIRYWSWNYRGCWHQTCPPIDTHKKGFRSTHSRYKTWMPCIVISCHYLPVLGLGTLRDCFLP